MTVPPAPVHKRTLVSLRLRLADTADLLRGRRDRFTPPRRLNFVGDSDFRSTGEEFLVHFRELADLSPSDRVLDIGCGIGRMARVLVRELAPPSGSYDGLDVARQGVSWCQRHYRHTPVPFRFRHVDLRHSEYNPRGTFAPERFTFPYPDASFDLAIATSLFTHLLEGAADRYLAETARVLAPGGRMLATWFVLDPSLPPAPSEAMLTFAHRVGAAWVSDPRAPEAAVAYGSTWISDRLSAHGLQLRAPIFHGSWTGRPGRSAQDIVVAKTSREATTAIAEFG
ncbi:MAG TPA: class I SAM-dependent methyltransferase [Solirubrobacteraceae bacterium]